MRLLMVKLEYHSFAPTRKDLFSSIKASPIRPLPAYHQIMQPANNITQGIPSVSHEPFLWALRSVMSNRPEALNDASKRNGSLAEGGFGQDALASCSNFNQQFSPLRGSVLSISHRG